MVILRQSVAICRFLLVLAGFLTMASAGPSPVSARTGELWEIPYGGEFWEHDSPAAGAGPLCPRTMTKIRDRVEHAFRPVPGGWGVSGATYRALAASEGIMGFQPLAPAKRLPEAPAWQGTFHLATIMRGQNIVAAEPGNAAKWQVNGNTAQRLFNSQSGIVEHWQAVPEGLEVTWIFRKAPSGTGDLLLETEWGGGGAPVETSGGMHFADAAGVARARVGGATLVDQLGRRWPLRTDSQANRLHIAVPASVLASASFPIAIDPLITAEFGLDQPVNDPSPCTRSQPAVAANSSGYLVAWTHGKGVSTDPMVFAARLSPEGQLLDPYGIYLASASNEQVVCAAAASESEFLVAWSAPRGTSTADYDLQAARISLGGVLLDTNPLPVCAQAGSVQLSPAVACNGSNYLVTWRDSRVSGIYGAMVLTNGMISPTNGFPISSAANEQCTPAVAALGADYLVAWQDYRKSSGYNLYSGIYGARVTGSGVLAETNGIAICSVTNLSQWHPAVAPNGTNWLVVWEAYDQGGNDICGARITRDGVVVETNGFTICHAANTQANPAACGLASGQTVVAWQDYRNTPAGTYRATVYGTRIQPDGTISDPDGVPLSTGTDEQWFPALASRGNEFLATWQDFRGNPFSMLTDIYSVKGSSGTVLTTGAEMQPSWKANSETTAAVAASGTIFLAVWADNRNDVTNGTDIYGLRLNADGVPLDKVSFPICSVPQRQVEPAVAGNGTNFLVTWTDFRNTPTNLVYGDIYGTLVNTQGVVLQPQGFPICTATNDQSAPTVTAMGSDYLVAWQDARLSIPNLTRWDIYGARVSSEGTLLDTNGFIVCNNVYNQTAPAAAGVPGSAMVVWTDARSAATDIYGTPVYADGSVKNTNGLVICNASGTQTASAIACNGQRYLAAWTDTRSSTVPDIYGTFIGLDGSAQPTNGFALRSALYQQVAPAVACNDVDFVVAWQEARTPTNVWDTYATGLRPDGRFFVPQIFQINTNRGDQTVPTIAATGNGGKFLVLQQAPANYVQRISANVFNLEALPRLDIFPIYGWNLWLWCSPRERYSVEYSQDLVTWTSFLEFTSPTNLVLFADPGIFSNPGRFYRAIWKP